MIPRINPNNFTWLLWRGGTLLDLGVLSNRKNFIVEKKAILKEYVIGYCDGSSLSCRPKNNSYAVMFQKGNLLFWTHLTTEEFNQVFMNNPMLITLGNTNKKAIVDVKNYDRVMKFNWYWKKSNGDLYYVATNFRKNGKTTTLYLHRFILDPSPNRDVHHRDENPLNNLEENLEEQDAITHRNWHNRNKLFKDVTKAVCQ